MSPVSASLRTTSPVAMRPELQRCSPQLILSSVEASSSPQGGERRHAGGMSSIDDAGEASKDQRDEAQLW
ncbi:MAG: hypothetical protein ACI9MR_000537 [Myxococcota bacterium]|jgi:hypothetical protein